MESKFKKLLPYLFVLIGFTLTIVVIIIIVDKLLFPVLIHSQETVKMPYLIGKKIGEAERVLSNLDLNLARVNELYSEQFESGTIINQSPRGGQTIKKGRDVYLTVSKGVAQVEVPYLIGQNIRNARFLLKNQGLEIGIITYINDERYGVDTVISQTPFPNAKVSYGKTVDLVVSRGSIYQVKVPFLEGLNLENALNLLKESELEVGNITYSENQTYLPNTVLRQGISAGELVNKGSKIDLTVVK